MCHSLLGYYKNIGGFRGEGVKAPNLILSNQSMLCTLSLLLISSKNSIFELKLQAMFAFILCFQRFRSSKTGGLIYVQSVLFLILRTIMPCQQEKFFKIFKILLNLSRLQCLRSCVHMVI